MVTMIQCAATHYSAHNEPSAVIVDSPCGTPWQQLLRTRPNVLVIGPRHATDTFVASASQSFRPPIVSVGCRDGLALKRTGTLVLRDVDLLDSDAQARLIAWLDDPANASTQIVSTSAVRLFSRVQAQQFAGKLYYRLNTVTLLARVV